MAQNAKKCPHCGVVDNYDAGPLTVCQSCGEVLAESWALGDAVTDIIDGQGWLENFRAENVAPPIAPVLPSLGAIARAEAVPGMLGPGGGSVDGLMGELRASQPTSIEPALLSVGPIGDEPLAVEPFAAYGPPDSTASPAPVFNATVPAGPIASMGLLAESATELAEALPLPFAAHAHAPAPAIVEAPVVRSQAVFERNPARSATTRPITADLPLSMIALGEPMLLMVPLTSPGVFQTVSDLIQGTAGHVAKEAIDTRPILVVRGLAAAECRALAERLERVGIPSKVRPIETPAQAPGQAETSGIVVVESTMRSWKRTAIAAAIAVAVVGLLALLIR